MKIFRYAKKALSKVSCVIPEEFYSCPDVQACLDKWKEVLVFYSLRLLIAPVVESLILLDRMLFLHEHGKYLYLDFFVNSLHNHYVTDIHNILCFLLYIGAKKKFVAFFLIDGIRVT